MKFEFARVTQMIEFLREQAGNGPNSIALLAASLAERFESIGWDVDHSRVVSSHRRWLTFWRGPLRYESSMIIARPRSAASAPIRVIFAAPFCFRAESLRRVKEAAPLRTSDLAGPAFLIELARTWPKSREQRIEVVALAAAGETLSVPGSQELLRRARAEWEPKPTLTVVVYGPGLGRELVVDAFPQHRLVLEAAEGLWVPIRLPSLNPFSAQRVLWPLRTVFPDYVIMAGAGSFEPAGPVLDPAALGRAEQLASEIVLRWARSQAERSAQSREDVRSDSRSFQNPG